MKQNHGSCHFPSFRRPRNLSCLQLSTLLKKKGKEGLPADFFLFQERRQLHASFSKQSQSVHTHRFLSVCYCLSLSLSLEGGKWIYDPGHKLFNIYINNSLYLARNMGGYLPLDILCLLCEQLVSPMPKEREITASNCLLFHRACASLSRPT